MKTPAYFDCNATTPIEPEVLSEVLRHLGEEYGNAGSRTHGYGARAKEAVNRSREEIARVVQSAPDEIVFTSGATESNNLAILGLTHHAVEAGRRHIISTQVEHKAVLEPLEKLAADGFEIELVSPDSSGRIDPDRVLEALRDDTILVSVMHVNNETGVLQPLAEICDLLASHDAYLHVDAAQSFGKEIESLRNARIDLISISGHKIYAPKGIGALVVRRRGYDRIPLKPLMYGGGQERGLRPGTLPVALIVGLGVAAELSLKNHWERSKVCATIRQHLLDALMDLNPVINGDLEYTVAHTLNLSFPGIDSEALMLALKDEIAISNGSACTSHSYQPSHVLQAMGLQERLIKSAVRFSWSHLSEEPDWSRIRTVIRSLIE